MTRSPSRFRRPHLLFGAVCLAVAGALVGVAALQLRGPDMAFVPAMATQPFVSEGGAALFVQAHEVTVAEWNRCADAGACDLRLRAPTGKAEADFPATGLNWVDVNQYLT